MIPPPPRSTLTDTPFPYTTLFRSITRDPVAKQICTRIMRDEVRLCAFGWRFLDYRIPQMTKEEIKIVENAVISMIEKVELNGYHSPWLAPANPASQAEMDVDKIGRANV